MKIELSDDTLCNIIVTELRDLHEHCTEEWYECEDAEELQKAVRLILKQYMIPSEHSRWALDRLVEHGEKHGLYESDDT